MSKGLKILCTIGILTAMIVLLADSQATMLAFWNGITAWAMSVLPAILPFMILSRLLVNIGTIDTIGGRALAKLSLPPQSGGIILLSILSGYPMGAKLISNSYVLGKMSTVQAIKTNILASTASPIFVIATLGHRLLNNTNMAMIILASHILGGIINMLFNGNRYQNYPSSTLPCTPPPSKDIMIDSLIAVVAVGAYIALFSTLCEMIMYILPDWCSNEGVLATSYLLGLLEMTTGCINICAVADAITATVLCCSLISFGGICITMQCMSFLKQCGIKYSTVLQLKVSHCAISTIICYVLVMLL